jgi:hypothetical protein
LIPIRTALDLSYNQHFAANHYNNPFIFLFRIYKLVSVTAESTTSNTTNAIKSSTSKSEPKEIEEAVAEELKSTTRNVIESQSPEEQMKRPRFPCSYCSRRFGTLEEVKRHIRYAHTPRHTTQRKIESRFGYDR